MKKNLFLLSALLFCILHVSAQNKTHVTIIDNGGVNENIILMQIIDLKTDKCVKNDTLELRQNKQTFDIDLTHYGYIQFKTLGDQFLEGFNIFPNTKLIVEFKPNNIIIGGSKIYKDINSAKNTIKSYEDKIKEYRELIEKASIKHDSIDKILSKEVEKVNKDEELAAYNYIKANPNNDGSVYLMRFCDNVDTVVTLLSDKVKNGIMKPIYDNEINIYKFEKKRKAQLINIAVGKKASDFTLKDINGKDVSLLSLRGKYVIIDFWGSWCHACIHGIPNMKEMYAKYHPTGKFEILNIDCSDTDVKWHETVKKYDMPWLNVKVPNGNNLLSVYAIRTFPTKFVIDPNGIIIYTIEGEDTSFYEYISMLFKDK